MGNLVVQATAMDLVVHQMAGILAETIWSFILPPGYDPITGLAIGTQEDIQALADSIRERDKPHGLVKLYMSWCSSRRRDETQNFFRVYANRYPGHVKGGNGLPA